jgi:hypothetical protein
MAACNSKAALLDARAAPGHVRFDGYSAIADFRKDFIEHERINIDC